MDKEYIEILKSRLESSKMFEVRGINLIDSQSVKLDVILKPEEDLPVLENQLYRFGEYEFLEGVRLLSCGTRSWSLPLNVAKILIHLLTHPHRIVKRDFLLFALWGNNDSCASKRLDVNICRLRSYLTLDNNVKIVTIKKTGLYLSVGK